MKNLLKRIKENEGFSEDVYKCSLGYDTIGYGFAIKDLKLSEEISTIILEQKVNELFRKCYDKLEWFAFQPEDVQGVIVEMVFQMGFVGTMKFKKMVGHLKKRNYEGASEEMLRSKWARSDSPNRARRLAQIMRAAA